MLCSWLHCWLGMMRYVWSTCLQLLWCRCDFDSWLMSWVLCHKLGRSTFNLHQRGAEGSDPLFSWAEGVPGAEMYRRISVQYGNSIKHCATILECLDPFVDHSLWHNTILELLNPFVDHPLWHDTVPILHWYPSMHFDTWYTFSP
jgi:hypothetical protein